MIATIISKLHEVSPQVGQRYGLCEKRGDVVYQYMGGGNGEQVNIDQNGTWSYFRITGPIKKGRDTETLKACDGWKYIIPLRFVLATRRDDESCGDHAAQIISTAASFVTAKSNIETALSAQLVKVDNAMIETDATRAAKNELNITPPMEVVLQYIDLTVEVLLDAECLDLCVAVTTAPPSTSGCSYLTVCVEDLAVGDVPTWNGTQWVNGAQSGGQQAIQFQDEGSDEGTSGGVDTVNFVGTGVSASESGGVLTVTVTGGTGNDPDAIHDNVAGEINALTTVAMTDGDVLVIEDASDSYNKKKILASTGGNGASDAGMVPAYNLEGQLKVSVVNSVTPALTATATGVAAAIEVTTNSGAGLTLSSASGFNVDASTGDETSVRAVNESTLYPSLEVINNDATNTGPILHLHADDGLGVDFLNDGGSDWTSATGAQTTATNLPVFGTATKGVVPASGGGTTNFLRADGSFAAPPGTGVQDGDVLSTGLTFPNTGLKILDAGGDHEVTVAMFDNSADRTLTIRMSDADRLLRLTGDANIEGTNSGDQTITNSSDATSHTVTLSASGGSVQLIEGSGVTLTTGGSASAGTVTIAASGGSVDWGDIGGTLSDQTDLQSALDDKIEDGDVLATGLTFPNANGVKLLDPDEDNTLAIRGVGDLAADRELRIDVEDADRNLVISGNADISGTNSGDVTLAGTPDYITISGQTITRGLVDLSTDVTGDLPLSNLAQASAASKLLGRGDSGAGDYQEISLGSGLTMTGTTLSASGGSGAPADATYIVQTANGTLSNEQALGALGTGILKNTTTTGVLSIAVAGDFPTLNQNTTGSAATLTTPRTINYVNFDGSANIIANDYTPEVRAYRALGSPIVGETPGITAYTSSASRAHGDGVLLLMAVDLPVATTLTGVVFYQTVQGSFTGDNENSISLYTYSGGTYTQVAISANDANIWKGTSDSWQQVPFTSTYAAAAGTYWVGMLYNNSAQTTAPSVAGGPTATATAKIAPLTTNSGRMQCSFGAQTAAGSSYAASASSAVTGLRYAALY